MMDASGDAKRRQMELRRDKYAQDHSAVRQSGFVMGSVFDDGFKSQLAEMEKQMAAAQRDSIRALASTERDLDCSSVYSGYSAAPMTVSVVDDRLAKQAEKARQEEEDAKRRIAERQAKKEAYRKRLTQKQNQLATETDEEREMRRRMEMLDLEQEYEEAVRSDDESDESESDDSSSGSATEENDDDSSDSDASDDLNDVDKKKKSARKSPRNSPKTKRTKLRRTKSACSTREKEQFFDEGAPSRNGRASRRPSRGPAPSGGERQRARRVKSMDGSVDLNYSSYHGDYASRNGSNHDQSLSSINGPRGGRRRHSTLTDDLDHSVRSNASSRGGGLERSGSVRGGRGGRGGLERSGSVRGGRGSRKPRLSILERQMMQAPGAASALYDNEHDNSEDMDDSTRSFQLHPDRDQDGSSIHNLISGGDYADQDSSFSKYGGLGKNIAGSTCSSDDDPLSTGKKKADMTKEERKEYKEAKKKAKELEEAKKKAEKKAKKAAKELKKQQEKEEKKRKKAIKKEVKKIKKEMKKESKRGGSDCGSASFSSGVQDHTGSSLGIDDDALNNAVAAFGGGSDRGSATSSNNLTNNSNDGSEKAKGAKRRISVWSKKSDKDKSSEFGGSNKDSNKDSDKGDDKLTKEEKKRLKNEKKEMKKQLKKAKKEAKKAKKKAKKEAKKAKKKAKKEAKKAKKEAKKRASGTSGGVSMASASSDASLSSSSDDDDDDTSSSTSSVTPEQDPDDKKQEEEEPIEIDIDEELEIDIDIDEEEEIVESSSKHRASVKNGKEKSKESKKSKESSSPSRKDKKDVKRNNSTSMRSDGRFNRSRRESTGSGKASGVAAFAMSLDNDEDEISPLFDMIDNPDNNKDLKRSSSHRSSTRGKGDQDKSLLDQKSSVHSSRSSTRGRRHSVDVVPNPSSSSKSTTKLGDDLKSSHSRTRDRSRSVSRRKSGDKDDSTPMGSLLDTGSKSKRGSTIDKDKNKKSLKKSHSTHSKDGDAPKSKPKKKESKSKG